MLQRVQVDLVDDLTGEVAQETVRFGLDGKAYNIDLTTENATKLRSTLSGYVAKGRKATTSRRNQAGQRTTSSSASTSTSRSKRGESQQIRQGAQDNGHNPSSRGRVTQSILDAYNETH